MNSRVLLIGRSGSGKTSLVSCMHGNMAGVRKTQAAEYHLDFIDVPGEYLEVRSYYRALIMLTCEACAIALLQAADDAESLYPSGLVRTFDKPAIGVVTKIDVPSPDIGRAEVILREAGAQEVFFTSAMTHEGIDELRQRLDRLRTPPEH